MVLDVSVDEAVEVFLLFGVGGGGGGGGGGGVCGGGRKG